jgi:uncharacterized glyoxalase superfamily protein PhnB
MEVPCHELGRHKYVLTPAKTGLERSLGHERLLTAGVSLIRKPQQEPWGLVEMRIADPDGVRIVLVEVPQDRHLRRD